MNKLLALVKVDFKNTYGFNSLIQSLKNRRNIWITLVMVLAILSLIPSYFMLVMGLVNLADAFFQIGQGSYFLQMGIFGSQALVFALGILYVLSKYYFASDLNQLVPLPIKPSYIIGSKFITLMFSEYLTSFPVLLPFIIIYGLKASKGVAYWVYSLIVILTMPIIPLVLASLLVMVFMKYTNLGDKKDLIRIISSIFFIVFIIWLQLTIQQLAMKSIELGDALFMNLAKDSLYLVKRLGIVFPPSMWATLALANTNVSGLLYLVLFLGISFVSIGLMIYLAERIFFDGLIGNIEVVAKERKARDLTRSVAVMKPYLAIAKKELLMLVKTPVYLLNSIGGVIIVPIILVMPILMGDESMDTITSLISDYPHFVNLITIGIIVVLAMVNSIGPTTFSREGKNLWIQRVLPIRARDQVLGRVLSSLAVQLLGILVLISAIYIINRIKAADILIITSLGLVGSIPMTQLGMVVDIARPMLDWDNPQRAMKQNFNVLVALGLGALFMMGLFFLVKNLIYKIDLIYIYLILFTIFITLAIILQGILEKMVERQFMELE